MGRLLAFAFLALIVFWTIACVAFVVRTAGRFWGADALPSLSSLVGPAGLLQEVAEAVFLFVIPLSIAVLLAVGIAYRGQPAPARSSSSWMDWKNPKVVVAITAWNDEEAIYETIREFSTQPNVIETIVVDNNSGDRTVAVAREQGARVVIEPKRGYGNVCIRGLQEALGCTDANIVVLAEGDMTFRASDMAKMIPYLEDVDMVVGTRTTYELTDADSQMDWFLSWGNLFLATLIRLRYWDPVFLGRVRLTDVGCTFRVMRKTSLEAVIGQLHVGDSHFSPHMILAAIRARLRIIEVPIKFRQRVGVSKGAGSSRIRAIRIGARMIAEILR